MKWIQDQTNSLYDPKIISLVRLHGMAGFGAYKAINELIADKESDDLTLEHDVASLVILLNEPKLPQIVLTCLKLKLFTKKGKKIQNLKIRKYIGNWQKRLQSNSVDPTETLQRPSVQKRREGREEKRKKTEELGALNTTVVGDHQSEKSKGSSSRPFNQKPFQPTPSETDEQKRQRLLKQADQLKAQEAF